MGDGRRPPEEHAAAGSDGVGIQGPGVRRLFVPDWLSRLPSPVSTLTSFLLGLWPVPPLTFRGSRARQRDRPAGGRLIKLLE